MFEIKLLNFVILSAIVVAGMIPVSGTFLLNSYFDNIILILSLNF